MTLTPDDLARLYAGYDRAQLERAIVAGPLAFTREEWIAICAECEKRGIPWNRAAEAPAPAAPVALKQCREAAIACGSVIGLVALGAGYLILDDWRMVEREPMIGVVLLMVFGFLFFVVRKIYLGNAVGLWTMGIMLAVMIWFAGGFAASESWGRSGVLGLWLLVPVGLEVMVGRAIMALRREN
jgi:hypothetical protein